MAARPIPFSNREPIRYTPEQKAIAVATVQDPVLFAERMLGVDVWDTQAAILRSIKNNRRTVVRACHASSKTFTAAIAVLWFLARYKKAAVITTAPTNVQVEKLLWGEVHGLLANSKYPFPPALLTEIKFNSKRYALGFSTAVTKSDEGVKAQGWHEDHVLVILDEAPGVHPKIWESIEGARAGGDVRLLALGNPTVSSGPFHSVFTTDREGWARFTISAFDSPNLRGLNIESLLKLSEDELDEAVRPYLIQRRWVKEKYYEWGEQHPSWESRVLGQFPKQADDALISLAWLEKAKISDLAIPTAKARAGLDVAGPGDAETVLTIRRGPRVIEQHFWAKADPRGEVVAVLMPYKEANDLESVNVDSIGIGWGMHLHLVDCGFPSVAVNVGESPRDSEKFANLKAELYWGLRLRIAVGDFAGLEDEKTIGQLAGIRYKQTPRGQTIIESKHDARVRGVASPDRAESVMLSFAELGTGLTIYRTSFTEDLIYDQATAPVGLGAPGSYQERAIAVGYGVANAMAFVEVCDTGSILYVTREWWFDGTQATKPKTTAEYIDALVMFAKAWTRRLVSAWRSVTGQERYVVRADDETEAFRMELMRRGLYQVEADVELLPGIQAVGTVFEKKLVRVSSACLHFIAEHKGYAWDSSKLSRGIEEPVATNKQTVEAFRHFVRTRINAWRLA